MVKKILLLIFLLFPLSTLGTTYYIDPTCESSGDGTTTTCGENGPFKTWGEVTWTAGNTYSQKGGTTYYGTITVGASGTAGNPITINSYGTGKAIINGMVENAKETWTENDPSAGIYSHAAAAYNGYNYPLLENGIFLQEKNSTSLTNGTYARPWIVGGTKHYYKPTDGTWDTEKVYGLRFLGINLQGYDYITITGFSITNCFRLISGYIIATDSSAKNSNIIITGNDFSNGLIGVGLGSLTTSASNNSVTYNTFDYVRSSVELFAHGGCDAGTTAGNNDAVNISYNTISHCSQVYTPSGPAAYDWSAVDLNCASGEDLEGIGTQDLINSSIHHNTITGVCRGIFMFTCANKDTFNNNIYNNLITTTRNPIILFPDTSEDPAAVSVYNNNFYYNILSGGNSDNYPTTILAKNTKTPSTTPNTFYNNTIIASAEGIYLITYADYFTFKNNIIYGATNYPVINVGTHNIYDYNLYYTLANGLYTGGTPYSFVNWKGLGYDTHSPDVADPLFVSVSDYHLQAGSPAINSGTSVGLSIDYFGLPINGTPDIGAYEYQTSSMGIGITLQGVSIR